jgi:hypothetical protein
MGAIMSYCNYAGLLLNEIGNADYQARASGMLVTGWSIFEFIGVGIAYFVRSWRILISWCIGAPLIVSCVLFLFIKESPLFLLSRRKFKQFKKVIKYTAKVNDKKLEKKFGNYIRNILSSSFNPRTGSEVKPEDLTDFENETGEEMISERFGT